VGKKDKKAIVKKLKEFGKDAFSYSAMSKLLTSPDEYINYLNKTFTDTPETLLGKAVHLALLEKEKLSDEVFIFDDIDKVKELGGKNPRATKVYKEWKVKEFSDSEGKIVLSKDQEITMNKIAEKTHGANIFFDTGQVELHIEGVFDFDGYVLPLHGYLDFDSVFESKDIKTFGKRITSFKYEIFSRNYDLQAYIYSKLNNFEKEFTFFVVETKFFNDIGIFEANSDILSSGEEKYNRAISNFIKWFVEGSPKDFIYRV